MTRRLRFLPLSLAVTGVLLVAACDTRDRLSRPPVVQTAPAATGPSLEPVHGAWETDKATALRAKPSDSAPVVASLPPGQPLKALGRARGTDWIAVQSGGSTAYVRLHLLRLRGTEPRTTRGATTTLAKPADNAGPAIKAAPRRSIEAAPITAP